MCLKFQIWSIFENYCQMFLKIFHEFESLKLVFTNTKRINNYAREKTQVSTKHFLQINEHSHLTLRT